METTENKELAFKSPDGKREYTLEDMENIMDIVEANSKRYESRNYPQQPQQRPKSRRSKKTGNRCPRKKREGFLEWLMEKHSKTHTMSFWEYIKRYE